MYGLAKIANEFEDEMDLKRRADESESEFLTSARDYVINKDKYIGDQAVVGAGLGTIPGLLGVAAANTIYRRKPLPKGDRAAGMIRAMQAAPGGAAVGFGLLGSLPGIIGGHIYGNTTFDKKRPEYKEKLDQASKEMGSAFNEIRKKQLS